MVWKLWGHITLNSHLLLRSFSTIPFLLFYHHFGWWIALFLPRCFSWSTEKHGQVAMICRTLIPTQKIVICSVVSVPCIMLAAFRDPTTLFGKQGAERGGATGGAPSLLTLRWTSTISSLIYELRVNKWRCSGFV